MKTPKWSPLAAHVLSGFESNLRIKCATHLYEMLRKDSRLTTLEFTLATEESPMPACPDLGIVEGTLAVTIGISRKGETTMESIAHIEVTAGELFFVSGASISSGSESLALSMVRLVQTKH